MSDDDVAGRHRRAEVGHELAEEFVQLASSIAIYVSRLSVRRLRLQGRRVCPTGSLPRAMALVGPGEWREHLGGGTTRGCPMRAIYPDAETSSSAGVKIAYEAFERPPGEPPTVVFPPIDPMVHSRGWKAQVPYLARRRRS